MLILVVVLVQGSMVNSIAGPDILGLATRLSDISHRPQLNKDPQGKNCCNIKKKILIFAINRLLNSHQLKDKKVKFELRIPPHLKWGWMQNNEKRDLPTYVNNNISVWNFKNNFYLRSTIYLDFSCL